MWKKEFFNTYFNSKSTVKEINNVLKMKNSNIPQFLFKYTNTNHIDDLLIDKLIYLPKITDLNDPFEGNVLHDLDIQSEKYLKLIFKRMGRKPREKWDPNFDKKKAIDGLAKRFNLNTVDEKGDCLKDNEILSPIISNVFMKKVRNHMIDAERPFVKNHYSELNNHNKNNTKLLCLTTSNTNNQMWANYANEHKGICIKYNTQKFGKDLIKNCFPVFYDNSNFTDELELESFNKMKKKLHIKSFLKKSTDWRCEDEWRVILPIYILPSCENHYHNANGDYLKLLPDSVYLGKNIDEIYRNLIIEICDNQNIGIYQMKQLDTQYELVEERI